jgi:hypothetical protein
MLIIHEALYFGDRQESTLLNSNQLRANGLIVEDVPRQYDLNSLHLIVAPKAGVTIPLSISQRSNLWIRYRHGGVLRRGLLPRSSSRERKPNSSEFANKEEMLIGGVSTLDERGAVLDRTVFESDTSIGKSMPLACSFHYSTRENG